MCAISISKWQNLCLFTNISRNPGVKSFLFTLSVVWYLCFCSERTLNSKNTNKPKTQINRLITFLSIPLLATWGIDWLWLIFSKGYLRYLALCLGLSVSPFVYPCVSIFQNLHKAISRSCREMKFFMQVVMRYNKCLV